MEKLFWNLFDIVVGPVAITALLWVFATIAIVVVLTIGGALRLVGLAWLGPILAHSAKWPGAIAIGWLVARGMFDTGWAGLWEVNAKLKADCADAFFCRIMTYSVIWWFAAFIILLPAGIAAFVVYAVLDGIATDFGRSAVKPKK